MEFKYKAELALINESGCNCPPDDLMAIAEKTAFRFVYDVIDNPNNFIPQSKKNPKRLLSGKSAKRCSGMALSVFEVQSLAKDFYSFLISSFPNIEKSIGTDLAIGTINAYDGLITDKDKDSHFDLHEFVNTDLQIKFQIIEKL